VIFHFGIPEVSFVDFVIQFLSLPQLNRSFFRQAEDKTKTTEAKGSVQNKVRSAKRETGSF
jgi:hypothetical protein